MKVCIVGAGGVGATIGARLAGAGSEVALLARGAHLQALRSAGLTFVDHLAGTRQVLRLPAGGEPADFGPQDLVVIALKTYAIGPMLPRLAPLLAPHTVVLPAINGLPWWYFHREGSALDGAPVRALDPDGRMLAALDCAHVIGCVVHFAAEVRAPGEVHHTSGRRLILGEPDGADSERLRRVCALLQGGGFEVTASRSIRLDVWTKLLGNLSFNPVAALTGYRMDQLCADEDVLQVIRELMREGMVVSARFGHPMPMTPDERIDLARQLGAARISMLQDLENRRPLELAAIVGAVIELAERADIAVPAIRMVHALAQARARALGIG